MTEWCGGKFCNYRLSFSTLKGGNFVSRCFNVLLGEEQCLEEQQSLMIFCYKFFKFKFTLLEGEEGSEDHRAKAFVNFE